MGLQVNLNYTYTFGTERNVALYANKHVISRFRNVQIQCDFEKKKTETPSIIRPDCIDNSTAEQ